MKELLHVPTSQPPFNVALDLLKGGTSIPCSLFHVLKLDESVIGQIKSIFKTAIFYGIACLLEFRKGGLMRLTIGSQTNNRMNELFTLKDLSSTFRSPRRRKCFPKCTYFFNFS